jgi:hypothetical protein
MTDKSEDSELSERVAWEPKTSKELRGALDKAHLATLRATPASTQAVTLMSELTKRYPRPQAVKGAAYARKKTLVVTRTPSAHSSPTPRDICNFSFPGLDLSRVRPLGAPTSTGGAKAT